jgi:SAM-dependent methyltransferase
MLTPEQDAYGQMMYDRWQGMPSYEIDERDDGFVGSPLDAAAYLAPFAEWPAHQQRAMAYAVGSVLDVGCGAGRCSLYLQEQGHSVLATDLSPLAIRTCRERGLRHAQVLSITELTARAGIFDTIIMLGNNFGLFGSHKRARWLLRRFLSLTSPRARIIAESTDPHQTTVPEHLAYQERNRQRGRLPGQIRLRIRYRTYRTPWFDYLLVSEAEMEEILAGTGWQVAEYLDSPGPAYVAVIERS